MTAENAAAPVLAGRGCKKRGALEMRRNRTTTPPRQWRRHIPTPADYYRQILADLGEPDQHGYANARCPLHPDTNRSLLISLGSARGGWRCLTCGARGDQVGFHMRRTALSFPLAVADLLIQARSMRVRRELDVVGMFALCKELAEKGQPLSSAERTMFERQKAEQRERDERTRQERGSQ